MSNSKPRRRSPGRIILMVVLVLAISLCVYSAGNIIAILSEDAESSEVTQEMRGYARAAVPAPAESAQNPVVRMDAPDEPARTELPKASAWLDIDFAGLQELNDEICAWIDIPGTDISYPVVQTDDNDYYLTHSADGSRNRAGAIFLDSRTGSSFTGRNTIIYGHRMNNGSMFGSLHQLENAEYLSAHPVIHVYLPGRETPLTYGILTTWESPASLDSTAYQVDFADDAAYADWLTGLENRSGETLTAADTILTLSTCVRGDGDSRFIVAARLLS